MDLTVATEALAIHLGELLRTSVHARFDALQCEAVWYAQHWGRVEKESFHNDVQSFLPEVTTVIAYS
jgi:hypothetical protein